MTELITSQPLITVDRTVSNLVATKYRFSSKLVDDVFEDAYDAKLMTINDGKGFALFCSSELSKHYISDKQ